MPEISPAADFERRLSGHTIYTQFQQMIGTPLCMSPENDGVVQRFPIPGSLPAGPHLLAISVHNAPQTCSDLRLEVVTLVEVGPSAGR
ncbi:MAG: hypothetical protein ACKV19_06405 [Verrucomicrobiales bacterium]